MDYRLGGESGSPQANCGGQDCWLSTVTSGSGYYEVVFESAPGPLWVAGEDVGAGLIFSWRDGYEGDIQVLPRGTAEIVQNLHLHPVRTVCAGESFTQIAD